jgi:hypothetical protein
MTSTRLKMDIDNNNYRIDMNVCEGWKEIWVLQYIADKIEYFGSSSGYVVELEEHLKRFFYDGHESLFGSKGNGNLPVEEVYLLEALKRYRLVNVSQELLEQANKGNLCGSIFFDHVSLEHLKHGLINKEVDPNVYVDRLFLPEMFRKNIRLDLQDLTEVSQKDLTVKNKARVKGLIDDLKKRGVKEGFVTRSFSTGLTKDQYFSGYGWEMIDLPDDEWSIWKACKN